MKVLCVYYSRTGITKKVAEHLSQQLQENIEGVEVALEELTELYFRKGVWNYIKSGFEAMRKKALR